MQFSYENIKSHIIHIAKVHFARLDCLCVWYGYFIMKEIQLTQGFVGVHVYCDKPHYRATIKVNGKPTFLGRFPFTKQGEIDAAKAYDKAAIEHHGSNCYLNF